MQRHTSRPATGRLTLLAPALAAVLVLAACGTSDDGGAPADADANPTTASTSPPGDGELRAPTPVEVVSGGAGGRSASGESGATEAAPAADDRVATSDMMIAPWVAEYVVGDGMPALPTDDTGFVFDANESVSPEQVSMIAAAFGVDGEPVRLDDGYGVSWRVGPDDGSAPSIWVYEDGQQSWNYNAAWGTGVVDVACAVSIDAEGNETSECPEPEPPVGVPSADEAEQRATEVISELGIDPATVTFETFADDWSASVNASDATDDRAAIRSWYFGFGGEGVLQYAGGSLAVPAPVGPYPLVDLDTAVARLSEGYFAGFGGGIAVAEPALAAESGSAVESAEESSADASPPTDAPAETLPVETLPAETLPIETVPVETVPVESVPVETVPVETLPAETLPAETVPVESVPVESVPVETLPVDPPMVDPPMVDPEPIVVTLVDVQADLWWAWDAEGVAWLLPAYRFIDTNGGWHVVPAVTDEFLIQADPVVDGPIPVEGDGGIGDGAEPLPTPESLPVEPDETIVVDPGADPEGALPVLEEFVGLSVEEFTAEAEKIGFTTRISMLDGESLAGTMDYRTDRVNVVVEGPRVVAIDSIG